MFRAKFWAIGLSLVLLSCGSENASENAENEPSFSPVHSYAQPDVAKATHLFLDIQVNIDSHEIVGWAHYNFKARKDADRIIFDAKNLAISKVLVDSVETANWWLGEVDEHKGQALEIAISDSNKLVSIQYTTRNPDAVFWMEREGQKTFMFTQSQAILARTWLPCQDSPGIRFSYDARVKVPEGYIALMSATNPTEKDSTWVYNFSMKQPIPSYLMALAVGDLEYRKLSSNTGVYALPEVIEGAAYEFEDMPKMIASAEKLYGKYAWEQYDVLVLPASFPFGGMENPRLTFATPTILAGDKSLTSLVAHELAHSWSGNLVTNATWNDFWLNEGFTVYFERRIMEDIYGKDYAEMLSILGWQDLHNTIASFKDQPEDTRLKLQLENRDPDDGMTDIAYEKGYFLLRTIEENVGRADFDKFVKKHFADNAFQTLTTEQFLANLKRDLFGGDQAKYDALKIDQWIYEPGIPENCVKVKSVLFEQVQTQLDSLAKGNEIASLDTTGWTTHQWLYFLRNMPRNTELSTMQALDKAFGFTNTGNAEIASEWFVLSINTGYSQANSAMEAFLGKVGRRKFLIPIYAALIESDPSLERARAIFEKSKHSYHSVSIYTLEDMLKL